MSRGKPAAAQLDLSNDLFEALDDYHTESGLDARNYGVLDGIPEAKKLFSDVYKRQAHNCAYGVRNETDGVTFFCEFDCK